MVDRLFIASQTALLLQGSSLMLPLLPDKLLFSFINIEPNCAFEAGRRWVYQPCVSIKYASDLHRLPGKRNSRFVHAIGAIPTCLLGRDVTTGLL